MGRIRDFFRRKENPAMQSVFATVAKGTPHWSGESYYALTEAGYKNCAYSFACVSLIAKTASRIDWLLKNKKGKEIESHALLDKLARPNENEGGIRFTEKVFSYELLNGNSYILKVQGIKSAPPSFLYTLRPDRMTVIPGNWRVPVGGWQYSAGTPTPLPAEDVLQLTEFHPLDDWYGLSRIRVAAHQIDILNESAAWNLSNLQHDMRASYGVNIKNGLTEEQRENLRKEIEGKHSGSSNAGRIVISEGDIQWTVLSLSAKDMDWINGQKLTMRQVCIIFGVPSELLGDSENKTYSNYGEARKALYEETVLPLMDIYVSELNNWLVPLYGDDLVLGYDKDKIEALQDERSKRYTYLAGANWLTINDKRRETGFEPIEGGDVLLVPLSEVPLGESGSSYDDLSKARRGMLSTKTAKASFWTEPERKARLWSNYEARVKAKTQPLAVEIEKFLRAEAKDVKRALDGLRVKPASASAVFDIEESAKAYQKEFEKRYLWMFQHALQAGLNISAGKLYDLAGDDFKAAERKALTPEQIEKVKAFVLESGKYIGEATAGKVEELIQKGIAEDWTTEELTQEIYSKLDELSITRSRRIAHTESAGVENMGTLDGMGQSEFPVRKGWLCSNLPTSREGHKEADDRYSNDTIPLDEYFEVRNDSTGEMERLLYPGDRSGGAEAGNLCECLCSIFSETVMTED